MAIGVGPSYPYGNFFNNIDVVSRNKELRAQEMKAQEANQVVKIDEDRDELNQTNEKRQNHNLLGQQESLEKFTFDFKKANDFNLVGAKSKVEDLDLNKALSDMKKDSVLDQYKFFVKSTLVDDQDGSVKIIKNENDK